MQIPSAAKEYVPDFKYILHDLSQLTEDDIIGSEKVQLFIRALRAAYARDIMKEMHFILKLLNKLSIIDPSGSYDYAVIFYLAKVNDSFDFDKVLEIDKKLKTRKEEIIMSAAEKLIEKGWKKGRQEGLQKGLQEGKREEKLRIAKKALMKGMNIDEVVELTELPREEVLKL